MSPRDLRDVKVFAAYAAVCVGAIVALFGGVGLFVVAITTLPGWIARH